MATNLVFSDIESLREVWTVGSEVDSGTPLLNGSKPGVALTDSGGTTCEQVVGPYTISGIPTGGVGLDSLRVSVATSGTWEFTGAKATNGSDDAPTSTAQGALVYLTSGGVISLQSSGNTLYGRVNYPEGYVKAAAVLPVKIGA